MNRSRLFLHPVLTNEKSRSLLIMYLLAIGAASTFLWWETFNVLKTSGVSRGLFYSPNTVPLLRYLLSPVIQGAIILFSVLIAAATTAVSIVGPVKRIEQWLMDWDHGYNVSPLHARGGDAYDNLIRLMNDLYMIKKPSRGGQSKGDHPDSHGSNPS